MNTAEMRAQLEERGEPWPDCDCHGESCYWQVDARSPDGGYFKCAVGVRQSHQKSRAERLEADGCVHCGAELETETLCARHAGKHADVMAEPFQRLLNRAAKGRHRQSVRESEGFRPSGAGFAAFAAWKGKQPGR